MPPNDGGRIKDLRRRLFTAGNVIKEETLNFRAG